MNMDLQRAVVERFWARVDTRTGNECWLWQGPINSPLARPSQNYGKLWFWGKHWRAHRVAWVLTHGPIPKGLCVLHDCDTPPCCNPTHLYLGTKADNHADMKRKQRGRYLSGNDHHSRLHPERLARGSHNGFAKLTEADVVQIRELSLAGLARITVAQLFSVTPTTISDIHNRKLWRHV